MMQVGVMRVAVHQRRMAVPMGMRLARRRRRVMLVAVMLVMDVAMLMLHRAVDVKMLVPFRDMEPKSERHQAAGGRQLRR